jgi:glucan 1,3-beta-glucosidase
LKPKYAGASEDGHPIRTAALSQPPAKKSLSRKSILIIVGVVLIVIIAVGVGAGVGISQSRKNSGGSVPATQGGPAVSNSTDAEPSKPVSSSSSSTKDPNLPASDGGGGQGVATTTSPIGALPIQTSP